MLKLISCFALLGLTTPLLAAILFGLNDLKVTFGTATDVTFTITDIGADLVYNLDSGGPNIGGVNAGSFVFSADDNPQLDWNLRTKHEISLTVGPDSFTSLDTETFTEVVIFRNSGRVDALVPLNFLLLLNGTAAGPGTAQIFARNTIQTKSGTNDWQNIFDASLNVSSSGPPSAVDFCTGSNICNGTVNLLVPADSMVRVRSVGTMNVFASQSEVPEPAALLLSGAGLLALLLIRRG
jgi:hypothetical protein